VDHLREAATGAGSEQLFQTLEKLKPLKPAFVSITYGASAPVPARSASSCVCVTAAARPIGSSIETFPSVLSS